jgi:hypothetical protein
MKNFAVRLFLVMVLLAPLGARAQDAASSQPLTSKLNITGSTVVKPAQGILVTFNVTTAGAVGAIYDSSTTGAAATLIAVIPAVVGTYNMQFPFLTGLLVVPGSAQVVSVSYR